MKIISLFFGISLSYAAQSQDASFGFWLPLKRLEQIDKLKSDRCDSASGYPFQKIKFFNNKEVSLFGFNAADPDVFRITQLKEKSSWIVKDSILNTLYPKYVFGSKIILKIRQDTLYVNLTKNGSSFVQKFIRKYGKVNFTDYMEPEIGNVLLKGKYIDYSGIDTIHFVDNGRVKVYSNKQISRRNFVSYQFKNYASGSCRRGDVTPRGIVELTDVKGAKEKYFIKRTGIGIDFYNIKKMNNWWTEATIELAFSLTYLDNVSN